MIQRSTDHGTSWQTIGTRLGPLLYGVWGDHDGRRLIATGARDVVTTSNGGGTWVHAKNVCGSGGSVMLGANDAPWVRNDFWKGVSGSPSTGTYVTLGGCEARGVAFAPEASMMMACDGCGGSFRAATTTPTGTWTAVGSSGSILRSTDDAATWQSSASDALRDGGGIDVLAADSGEVFMLQHTRLMRSSDDGKTFSPLAAFPNEE